MTRSPRWLETTGVLSAALPAAVIFALIGGAAVTVGALDATSARDIQYRLIGVFFLACGATLLAGAVCLAVPTFREKLGRAVGTLAGVAGLVAAGCLLIMQLQRPQSLLLARWAAVALASAVALVLVHRSTPPASADDHDDHDASAASSSHSSSYSMSRVLRRIGSLGAAAGLLWAVTQFWFTNAYLPATTGPALTIDAQLDEHGLDPDTGLRLFRATVKMKNVSSTKVQVVSSLYAVTWLSQTRTPYDEATRDKFFKRLVVEEHLAGPDPTTGTPNGTPDKGKGDPEDNRFSSDDDTVSRHAQVGAASEILQLGKSIPDASYFEPGEEYINRFLVRVPDVRETHKDMLQLSVQVLVAKGNRLVPSEWESHKPDYVPKVVSTDKEQEKRMVLVPGRYIVTELPIERLSRLHELTSGSHAVNIVEILTIRRPSWKPGEEVEAPALVACIDQVGRFEQGNGKPSIRSDPLRICPGLIDPRYQNRQNRKMQAFFGLVATGATDERSLLPKPKPATASPAGTLEQAPTVPTEPETVPTTTPTPDNEPEEAPEEPQQPPGAEQGTSLQILNGTREAGLAHRFSRQAAHAGYRVVNVGNAYSAATSVVYYTPGHKADAEAFRRRFPQFATLERAPANLSNSVALHAVLGASP